MKIISFNIRIQVEVDGLNQFLYRYQKIADYINQSQADFVSLQEMNSRMKELLIPLLPDYDYVGEARELNGETSGILYHRRWNLVETKTVWLSDTPFQESKYIDSYFKRVATYGRFAYLNEEFKIVNTHLDYHGEEIQEKQMKILLNEFDHETLIITGDFNAVPKTKVHQLLEHFDFCSVYQDEDLSKATYQGFQLITNGQPIDYIYYKGYVKKQDAMIDQTSCRDFMLSDHYPIIAYF